MATHPGQFIVLQAINVLEETISGKDLEKTNQSVKTFKYQMSGNDNKGGKDMLIHRRYKSRFL